MDENKNEQQNATCILREQTYFEAVELNDKDKKAYESQNEREETNK